jgi:hypothetical protein
VNFWLTFSPRTRDGFVAMMELSGTDSPLGNTTFAGADLCVPHHNSEKNVVPIRKCSVGKEKKGDFVAVGVL